MNKVLVLHIYIIEIEDIYLHHGVEVKFLEFHLQTNNAEIKPKENKSSVDDCWSPWWWQLMARREERERQVPDTGLQWASHGTGHTMLMPLWNVKRDHHWPIMTVGPLRTSCQLRSVSCVVFHKSALSGSAVRGLLSVLEIGFHMIITSQPQGKKVQHTRKQKMASLHSNL